MIQIGPPKEAIAMTDNTKELLTLLLEPSQQSYSAGEAIDVTLILKNESNSPVTVNKRMGINPGKMLEGTWEVKFNVTFPPGERLITATLINRGKPTREDFVALPPGHEIRKVYTLSDYYWMELPGTYNIKAIYHNSDDGEKFGFSAWKGDITSNVISLEVLK